MCAKNASSELSVTTDRLCNGRPDPMHAYGALENTKTPSSYGVHFATVGNVVRQ